MLSNAHILLVSDAACLHEKKEKTQRYVYQPLQ